LGREHRDEAVTLAREALDLAEMKGAPVLVEEARALLTDLERPA
jgi:hypothetical protein